VARALVTGKTQMVSLLMPAFNSQCYSQVVEHVQRILKGSAIDTIISQATDSISLSGWPVDGILAHRRSRPDSVLRELRAQQGIPYVSFGGWDVQDGDGDHVYVELYQGCRDAVEHMISSGRRRILYMPSGLSMRRNDSRRRAYADVMQEAGLERDYLLVEVSDDREAARANITAYIRDSGCPKPFLLQR